MAKPKSDPIREDRILNEVVVDAYGPEERAMGWYYYLENKIRFPFHAQCIAIKIVSPLRKGESIEARQLAPEDACASDMLVLGRWHGRDIAVPLAQLTAIDADESTAEAISDWHYCGARRLLLNAGLVPTCAGLPKGHDELLFSHIVDGEGWTTQFILFSGVAGQSSSGTLRFFSDNGTPLDLTLQ